MTIRGLIGNANFAQLVLISGGAFFWSGLRSDVANTPWNMIAKQSGSSHGYVPYHHVWGTGDQVYLANSLLYQGDGRMGIGTAIPHALALLDLASTARGFLPPRMTTAQRDATTAPAEGLFIS